MGGHFSSTPSSPLCFQRMARGCEKATSALIFTLRNACSFPSMQFIEAEIGQIVQIVAGTPIINTSNAARSAATCGRSCMHAQPGSAYYRFVSCFFREETVHSLQRSPLRKNAEKVRISLVRVIRSAQCPRSPRKVPVCAWDARASLL